YDGGRPRRASLGFTYMIDVRPRISRGRMATRMKLVGSSFDATASTGSRPLSHHAPARPHLPPALEPRAARHAPPGGRIAHRDVERPGDETADAAASVAVRQRDA